MSTLVKEIVQKHIETNQSMVEIDIKDQIKKELAAIEAQWDLDADKPEFHNTTVFEYINNKLGLTE